MTYLLFSGPFYYPSGGAEDLKGEFPTIDEAKNFAEAIDERYYVWAHIVDRETLKIVLYGDNDDIDDVWDWYKE